MRKALVLLLLLPLLANAQFLNMPGAINVYKVVEAGFDGTQNTIYISVGTALNFSYEARDVLDFKVERDGAPYAFKPRLDAAYTFALGNDTKITYLQKNVVSTSGFWYPFNTYSLTEYSAQDAALESCYVVRLKIPQKTTMAGAPVISIVAPYKGQQVMVSPNITVVGSEAVTPPVCLLESKVKDLGANGSYDEFGNFLIMTKKMPSPKLVESHYLAFTYNFFPAKFLFVVLFLYLGFLSIYHVRLHRDKNFWDRVYFTYIYVVPVFVFAELIVFLDAQRPGGFTLFDALFFLPLGLLLLFEFLGFLLKFKKGGGVERERTSEASGIKR